MIGIVQGTLKGHDQLMNLVLDDVQETLRGTSIPASTSASSILHFHSTLHLLIASGYVQMTKAIHPPAPSAS